MSLVEVPSPPPLHEQQRQHAAGDEGVVLAFGNPLLDMSIVVQDSDGLIKKYGIPVDGQIEVEPGQRELFDEVLNKYPVEYVAGGGAQNTLRILQRLMGSLTWQCYMIGKIGRDQVGQMLCDLLSKDGVRTRYAYDATKSTGCCVAVVRGETRSLAADIGAAAGFRPEHLVQIDVSSLFNRCRILYIESYFVTHSAAVAVDAVRCAHSLTSNAVRLLSLSAAYVCRQFYAHIMQMFPYVNLLIGNREELLALAESLALISRPVTDDVETVASSAQAVAALPFLQPFHDRGRALSTADSTPSSINNEMKLDWTDLNERLVIVTGGSEDVICATRSNVWRFAIEPCPAELLRDTTGAGDAFLAGFLSQMIRHRFIDASCVSNGDRTAKLTITQTGCRLP